MITSYLHFPPRPENKEDWLSPALHLFVIRRYNLAECWKAGFLRPNQSHVFFLKAKWLGGGLKWAAFRTAVHWSPWIPNYWSYCCIGKLNLGQLPCQQSPCWLSEGKTAREYNQRNQRSNNSLLTGVFIWNGHFNIFCMRVWSADVGTWREM